MDVTVDQLIYCCIHSLGPQWWSLPFENALFSYRCWWSLMAAPIISQFGSPILIQQVNHNDTFTEYICPVNSASCLLPVNLNAPSGHILLHAFFWPRNITVQKQAINKIKSLQYAKAASEDYILKENGRFEYRVSLLLTACTTNWAFSTEHGFFPNFTCWDLQAFCIYKF